MTVVVVTDTSCRLPADLREQWSIRQVPLHILLDGLDLRDGVDEIPMTSTSATPPPLGRPRLSCPPPTNGRWRTVAATG